MIRALSIAICVLGHAIHSQQLWAQNKDARGTPERLTQAVNDFYKPNDVQTIHLLISEVNQQRMQAALPECIYVPAEFRWRETTLRNVAVRFKGNSSSNPRQSHKRSYLIKFDEFEKNRRFLGLRRVSFDNGVQFGSLFSEPIITEIISDLGITTHRCNYAKVYVNQTYQGVFGNVERIDESFIERSLPDPNGALWKNDLGGPGGDLRFIGSNPEAYKKAFEPKNKVAKKTTGELIEFIRSINQTPPIEFEDFLQSAVDVDKFLSVTAVMLLSGAFDQLTGWGPHNFYLYHDTKQNQWHYMPWDLDVGFAETAFGRVYALEDWNAAWPVPVGHANPILDRIIANPVLLARYRQIAAEVLEKYFEPNRLCNVIDQKYALIKVDLETDPFPHRRATVPTDKNYDDIVASMKTFMRKRYSTAQQQLKDPGRRPIPVVRPNRPGPQRQMGPPPEFVARVQQVQRSMQKRMQAFSQIMQQIGPLVEQGKLKEAEALLEKAAILAK